MSVAKQLYLQKFKHCGCLTDQVTEGLVMVLVTEWKKFHSEIWFVAYLNITFDCLCKAHYSENNFYITLCRLSIWYASICMQILMIMWRYLVWFLRTPKWWQDNDREAETLSGSVRWGQLPATIKLFVLQKMTRVNSVKLNICTSVVTFVQCLISVLFIYLSMYFFLLLFDIKQPVRQNFTPQGHKMSQNTAPLQAPFHVKAVYVCFCMSLDSHGNL